MSTEKIEPLLMCEVDSNYLIENVDDKKFIVDKKYFLVINPMKVMDSFEYPTKIYTKDADGKMILVHEEDMYYDSIIEILQFTANYLNWEKETFDIFKCNEKRQKKTKYGEIEAYKKPIISFVADATDEGTYIVFVHKTINEDMPFFIRGIFKPNDDKKTDNHCYENGLLSENGYGYCSAITSDLDYIDESFDYGEADIVSFIE